MISITRKIDKNLDSWSKKENRKVLLLRGPRQVGKTYSIRKHAKLYSNFLDINFLSDKKAHDFFKADLNIDNIIQNLSAYYNTSIVDEKTLIFFDEIQECPDALVALRFFYEKRPNLHIIAAGSMLEFALSEIPSFGVGRIESIYLHPVSFDEYLGALGEEGLIRYIQTAGPGKNNSNPIHDKILSYLKVFFFHGGLPEIIVNFLENKNYNESNILIDKIRISYEDDLIKYRKKIPENRLKEVFRSVSLQAGKKFIHSHAYPDANAGQVHNALEILTRSGIVHKIHHTSSNGIPLGGEVDIKKFKVIPFDHGIYQRIIGVTPAEIVVNNFDPINKGAMAEVYAGCSILAHSSPYTREGLFYWHREAKSSNAELDYILQINGKIMPLEIKSGSKGKMKSMNIFFEEKRPLNKKNLLSFGIRSSMENFGKIDNILVIPLYALSQIERLTEEALG